MAFRPFESEAGERGAEVAENWLRRHVEQKKLRYRRTSIAGFSIATSCPSGRIAVFVELRRSDITVLLDMIEDKHGARQADVVLTTLRSIASWVHSATIHTSHPSREG